jgi:hypothetical protein
MVCKKVAGLSFFLVMFFLQFAEAQSGPPSAFQVIMYSFTLPSGAVPAIFSYNNGTPTEIGVAVPNNLVGLKPNFNQALPFSTLASTLSASIATELSVIPIASPASGVITRIDPDTGAELPVSSTLGPIFTERGETIGKHKFFIGFSNQDFHFTSLNGQDLRGLRLLLDTGGRPTGLTSSGVTLTTYPATAGTGVDVRLGQNIAFLTYGLTDRLDVSVGLPIVHASISGEATNAQIYIGDGTGQSGQANTNCWCLDTFTPGVAPVNRSGLQLPGVINNVSASHTGFGDMLLRGKGTVIRRNNLALALGADLRVPTGDAHEYLGTGATAIKPFLALSLYTTPLSHGIVFSPHANIGWQYSGKSVLGGQFVPSILSAGPPALFGVPFNTSKGYLPDVFSWAVGTEVALGRRNTVVADILGNQIGWVHGISNMKTVVTSGLDPTCTTACKLEPVSGLVGTGPVSLNQYSGAFGYKVKIAGNLVGTFNMLVRFDNNGLVARAVPLFGLSYTF